MNEYRDLKNRARDARTALFTKSLEIDEAKNEQNKFQWITPEIRAHIDSIIEINGNLIIEEKDEASLETSIEISNMTLALLSESAPTKERIEEYQLLAMRVQGKPSAKWQKLGIVMMALGVALMAIALTIISGGAMAPVVVVGAVATLGGLGMFSNNMQKGQSKTIQKLADDLSLSSKSEAIDKTVKPKG